MKYLKFVLFMALMMVIGVSCGACTRLCLDTLSRDVLNKPKDVLPRHAFVIIQNKVNYKQCLDKEEKICLINKVGGSGSGFIIDQSKSKGTYIVTAAHVCDYRFILKRQKTVFQYKVLNQKLSITDLFLNKKKVNVVAIDNQNDICLLYSEKKVFFPAVKIAKSAPKPGDRVYNIAAPRIIFSFNMVPIFEGFFNGTNFFVDEIKNKTFVNIYSLPSYKGSSGSMVLNHRGELIGTITGFIEKTMISIGPTYKNLIHFINNNKHKTTAISTIDK